MYLNKLSRGNTSCHFIRDLILPWKIEIFCVKYWHKHGKVHRGRHVCFCIHVCISVLSHHFPSVQDCSRPSIAPPCIRSRKVPTSYPFLWSFVRVWSVIAPRRGTNIVVPLCINDAFRPEAGSGYVWETKFMWLCEKRVVNHRWA